MNRYLKRLIIAIFISAGCYGANLAWFKLDNSPIKSETGKSPIARLSAADNDVQRKPQTRIIWQSLAKNDDLFTGEAVRTSDKAEAKIHLLKSGATISMEPNSLIVLEENEHGINLDFLEGNLFIAQSENSANEDLTLKTKSAEVKIGAATEVSASHAEDGQIDLAVVKGQAELQQGNKTLKLDPLHSAQIGSTDSKIEIRRLQILSPRTSEPLTLDLIKGEKVEVKFSPPPPGYKVNAQWGPSRADLIHSSAIVDADSGRWMLPVKSGKWFLRISATSEDKVQPSYSSPTISFTVGQKAVPTTAMVKPNQEFKAPPPNVVPQAKMVWAKVDSIQEYSSAQPSLFVQWLPFDHAHMYRYRLNDEKTWITTKQTSISISVPADGDYHFKAEAIDESGNTIAELEPRIFSLRKSPLLPAPRWLNADTILKSDEQGNLNIEWHKVEGAKYYLMILETEDGKVIDKKEIKRTTASLSSMKPGQYRIKIKSVDSALRESVNSAEREFSVPKVSELKAPRIKNVKVK